MQIIKFHFKNKILMSRIKFKVVQRYLLKIRSKTLDGHLYRNENKSFLYSIGKRSYGQDKFFDHTLPNYISKYSRLLLYEKKMMFLDIWILKGFNRIFV